MIYQPNELLGDKGQYRIMRLIGEGAMGEVYEAEQTKLHKIVAIKVMHGDITKQTEFVKRFQREAFAAAALNHPNICTVSDYDSTADGGFFLVMEMLSGETLQKRLRSVGTMMPAQAIYIMRQLLSALQSAHEKDIVHRDVKPDNIYLVMQDGAEDFVKLIDFGIAHWDEQPGCESHNSADMKMTRAGELYGTPQYLSPEQARGDNVDNRADLYACGVILFEMLTGHTPFVGENYIELLHKHLSEAPPHLPENIDQSAELDAIIQKLLEKEPDNRYACARDVIADLSAVFIKLDFSASPKLAALSYPGALHVTTLVPSDGSIGDVRDGIAERAAMADLTPSDPQLSSSSSTRLASDSSAISINAAAPPANIQPESPSSPQTAPLGTQSYIVPLKPEPDAVNKMLTIVISSIIGVFCLFALLIIIIVLWPTYDFHYDMNSFEITMDEAFVKDQNMINALQGYSSEDYEQTIASLEAVKDKYDDRPDYWMLYLQVAIAMDKKVNKGKSKKKNADDRYKDEVYISLKNLLYLAPDAARNTIVKNEIFSLLDNKEYAYTMNEILRGNEGDETDAARGIAILILKSAFDKPRLKGLFEDYDAYQDIGELNTDEMPWLDEAVELWRPGKVKCGPQLEALKNLYNRYQSNGFYSEVLIPMADDVPHDCTRDWLLEIVDHSKLTDDAKNRSPFKNFHF